MSVSSIFNGFLPLSNLTLNNFTNGVPSSSILTCSKDSNNDAILNVSTGATFQGNLVVSGTIESSGGGQQSDIALTNVENTFSENQIFQDSISIGSVSGGLTVSTATANAGAVIYGAVTINGNLLVDGNLDVTGTGGGGGGTGGDYAFQDQANIFTALNTFEEGITISASGANITGVTEITGATTVNGAMTIDGNTAITGTLTVNGGDISSGGGSGSDLLSSANTWIGTNTFDETVSVASTLGVSGDCTFGNGATNTITVKGNLVVTGTITDDQGGTVVDPNTAYTNVANTFTPDQTFNGSVTVGSNVVSSGLIVNGGFSIAGSGSFNDQVIVKGVTTLEGDSALNGTNTFNGFSSFNQGVSIASGNLVINNANSYGVGIGSVNIPANTSYSFSLNFGTLGTLLIYAPTRSEFWAWNFVYFKLQSVITYYTDSTNTDAPSFTYDNANVFTVSTKSYDMILTCNGSPILAPNPYTPAPPP